jgi:predicted RNase H-like HicB family nuclease
MTEIIFLVEEDPEGGYTAKAIGESIFTQGETMEEIREMVRDAVQCHFEEEQRPKLIRLHIVRDEVIAPFPAHRQSNPRSLFL